MPRYLSSDIAKKIAYRVVRSHRRTLAIEVRAGGEVLVRAPYFVADSEIRAFVDMKQDWLRAHVRRMAQKPLRRAWTQEETERLIGRARQILPGLVESYASRMGLHPAGIAVTGARTRYGSCSVKGRLCFSCYLMDSPIDAIEYVVVHELCHLRHMNHGQAFYALLEKTLPDWRTRKGRLQPI